MSSRIIKKDHSGDEKVLSIVMDTKTHYTFQVVRVDQENLGLVFGTQDIIKIPIWQFFMIARATREAENRLLSS